MFTKNHFNNLQDMVTLHDNGNWKNALKAYDTRKTKGKESEGNLEKNSEIF